MLLKMLLGCSPEKDFRFGLQSANMMSRAPLPPYSLGRYAKQYKCNEIHWFVTKLSLVYILLHTYIIHILISFLSRIVITYKFSLLLLLMLSFVTDINYSYRLLGRLPFMQNILWEFLHITNIRLTSLAKIQRLGD